MFRMTARDPNTSLAVGALVGLLSLVIAVALGLLATGHSPRIVPTMVAIAVPIVVIVLVVTAQVRRRAAR